ncbi:hypothetical protein MRX96_006476 [Rhipicephalus microplus]
MVGCLDVTDYISFSLVNRGQRTGHPAKAYDGKAALTGTPIKVVANYFRILSLPQLCVHQYHVDFLPLVESSCTRRALINDHREQFCQCFLFDALTNLKIPRRMPHDIAELYSRV